MKARLQLAILRALGLFLFCALTSCAKGHRVQDDTARYFPLEVGDEWTYDQRTPEGATSVTFRIVAHDRGPRGENRFVLEGPDTERYFFAAFGQRGLAPAEGIWTVFLQSPLQLGGVWPAALAVANEHALSQKDAATAPMHVVEDAGLKRVAALGETVTVPAGTFSGCVRVDHSRGDYEGRKYYAPGVGLVLTELFSKNESGQLALVQRQELTHFKVGE